MTDDFDLFGNPIIGANGKRGRPEHEPTQENIIFVMVLLAAGYTNKHIAVTLGLTVPTLRKHYFHLLRERDVMLDRIRTKLRVTQIQQGLSGNASALMNALRMVENLNVEKAASRLKEREAPKSPMPRRLGKKEEQQLAAQNVGGKFAPPSAPKLIVHNK